MLDRFIMKNGYYLSSLLTNILFSNITLVLFIFHRQDIYLTKLLTIIKLFAVYSKNQLN